jgi:hypothetical protein
MMDQADWEETNRKASAFAALQQDDDDEDDEQDDDAMADEPAPAKIATAKNVFEIETENSNPEDSNPATDNTPAMDEVDEIT